MIKQAEDNVMMTVRRATSIDIDIDKTRISFYQGNDIVEQEFDTVGINTYNNEYARVGIDNRLHLIKILTVEIPGVPFDYQFNLHYDEIISPDEKQLQQFIERDSTIVL